MHFSWQSCTVRCLIFLWQGLKVKQSYPYELSDVWWQLIEPSQRLVQPFHVIVDAPEHHLSSTANALHNIGQRFLREKRAPTALAGAAVEEEHWVCSSFSNEIYMIDCKRTYRLLAWIQETKNMGTCSSKHMYKFLLHDSQTTPKRKSLFYNGFRKRK
jgi:hypothetical protein